MKKSTIARRHAYGRLLGASSLTLQTLSNLNLSPTDFEDRRSGESILSKEEREYADKLKDHLHKLSTHMLNFSHKLEGR